MKLRSGLLLVLTVVIALAIGLVIGLDVSSQDGTVKATSKAAQAKPPTRAELLKLVNAERKKVGVAPLKEIPQLDTSAQYKADDMAKYHYFGHENPKTGKANGLDKILSLDAADNSFKCVYVSENLIDNTAPRTDARGLVASWKKSPPHYKAMISSKYTLTGFGVNGEYVVEHFCEQ